ncbi:metal-dependent hydrolase [Halalkalicoccus ordinarius]|uniref:metal-dependent hydrolase n=1 Tax=Halalkalicoccus ordinarius TaxID=3116651 RepID=UPI00300EA37F
MNKRGHVLNAVLLSIGLGYVVHPAGDVETLTAIAELFVPIVLGALFPDVDAVLGRHRKTLHNLPVLAVVLAYPIHFANLHWVWIGVLTHYVLDLLGTRRGLALFYPFWEKEYGLPFGVPVSSRWAPYVVVLVTAVELAAAALLVHGLPPELAERALAAIGAQ